MKINNRYLFLGMGVSMLLHVAVYCPLFFKDWTDGRAIQKPEYSLVAVQIKPKPVTEPPVARLQPVEVPEPEQPPPKKKQQIKTKRPKKVMRQKPAGQKIHKNKSKDTLPASNKTSKADDAKKKTKAKPVFGAARDSVVTDGGAAMAVRVGNTLMKEQEEEFTPAEAVEDYYAVPPFELSSLPLYKVKVVPDYPESLKAAEIEGQVLLSVTIDHKGKVVAQKVKRSDDLLFAKAAMAALNQCEFTPGMQNGVPVTTIIDIPIKFILDE